MCEPRNRDNGASDLWTLTVYRDFFFLFALFTNYVFALISWGVLYFLNPQECIIFLFGTNSFHKNTFNITKLTFHSLVTFFVVVNAYIYAFVIFF